MQSVAFIGLGIMGAPMAGHVLAAGHPLVVHSRSRTKSLQLEKRGALWADSPADAARQADVICICVPDTPDVEAVIGADNGVVHGARPGAIVVDHSTIAPRATRRLAAELAAKDVQLLDAPVSGGDAGAKAATLAIMIGGDKGTLGKVDPVLSCYGKTITHCGASGAGQYTKLVNQILVSVNLVGVAEALAFARSAGLNLNKTIAAIGGGAAASWQLANLGPKIANGDDAPGFMIDLLLKDLRLLAEAADESAAPLAVMPAIRALFQSASAAGHGRDGTQAVRHAIGT